MLCLSFIANKTPNTQCCICIARLTVPDRVQYDLTATDGVIDLTIAQNTIGSDASDLENEVTSALSSGDPLYADKYDLVMICLPAGTSRGGNLNWIAYAYVGGAVSVYNGGAKCANEDNQMHEVGHNWGLR